MAGLIAGGFEADPHALDPIPAISRSALRRDTSG
jgi:hypothetical protein